MGEAYSVETVLGLAALGLAGSAANLCTLVKVASGFDKRKVGYFLAYLDTLASTVGYMVFTFSTLVGNLITRDPVNCALMVMSLYIPHMYGLITTAQVSIIRYYSIRCARQNKVMPLKTIKRICISVLALFTTLQVGQRLFVDKRNNVSEACMGRKFEGRVHPLQLLFSAGPLVILPILSLTFDLVALKALKATVTTEGGSGNKDAIDNSLPIKATVFSSTIAFAFLVSMPMWARPSNPPAARVSGVLLVVFVNCMRCSISTRVTFKARKDAKEARRTNGQEMERMHARNLRDMRQRVADNMGLDPDLAAVIAITRRQNQQRRGNPSPELQGTQTLEPEGEQSSTVLCTM